MQDLLIRKVTDSYRECLAKIGWKPGVVPLTVEAPWYSVVEWSAPSYERDGVCGVGALVGPRHVLTCAQRVNPKMDERIVCEGGLPVDDKSFRVHVGGASGATWEVQQVIPHPKFRPLTTGRRGLPRKSMDLAILVLTGDVGIPPVPIAPLKSVRPYERISALGNGPLAGAYDPVQFDTAQIYPMAAAPAKPWGKEFVVANAPGPDTMDAGFLGAPLVTKGAGFGGTKLLGLVSRAAMGLPTEEALGAPCVATDVIRQAKWIAAAVAAHPGRR